MKKNDIINSLSVTIYCNVMQELAEKYAEQIDAANGVVNENEQEVREESKDVNNVSSDAIATITDGPEQDEVKESSYSKVVVGIVAVIAIAVVGLICFFAFNKSQKKDSILGLQQPKWEKFVHMTGKETAFYKSPDTSSPRLMQASNADGCGVICQNYWSDEKPNEDMTNPEYYPYTDETSVFPVVEENGDWYKVYIQDRDKRCEAYVEKSQCEEVAPEPITQEVLSQIDASYNLQKGGKYDNICFMLDSDEGGNYLSIGELLNDKCLAFSSAYHIYIAESDTTLTTTLEENSYVTDDGDLLYSYLLHYGPSRSVSLNGYTNFDTQKITSDEMEQFVNCMKKIKNETLEVSYGYYFPSVSTSHLFYFYTYGNILGLESTEGADEKHVTEYKVVGKSLMALHGDEWIETGFTTEGSFEIYQQQDLDEDGNVEIVLQDYEGNYIDNPFVIYYDKATNSFKQTESMELEQSPSIETEESGAALLVQNEDLRTIKYQYADGKLKIVSDKMKNVGKIHRTIRMEDVFPGNDDYGDRNLTFDFDGDGEDENVVFYRGESHADGYGKYMSIVKIVWVDGREVGNENSLLLSASIFRFLASETNGMPDIIADNTLKKWNGSSYE